MRILVLLLTAAACAPKPAVDAAAPATTMCNAAVVQDFVGRPATTVRAEAQRRSGAGSVRLYRSGDAVTMDYRKDRLNVETDADGRIAKLSCG